MAAAGLSALVGCGSKELASGWHDRDVDSAGLIDDWSGAVTTLEGDELSVGVLNDAKRLYLFLYPESGPAAFALFGRGFTLWFEGDEGTFGLRFLREMTGEQSARPDPQAEGADPADREAERARRLSTAGSRLAEALREVEVLDADGNVTRRGALGEMGGVALRFGQAETTPWVQVEIALASAGPEAIGIGAKPGQKIGVGLVTPEIEMPASGGRGGRRPPGGRGGGGERPGRGGGRRGPPDLPDPFEVSGRVRLATGPEGSSLF